MTPAVLLSTFVSADEELAAEDELALLLLALVLLATWLVELLALLFEPLLAWFPQAASVKAAKPIAIPVTIFFTINFSQLMCSLSILVPFDSNVTVQRDFYKFSARKHKSSASFEACAALVLMIISYYGASYSQSHCRTAIPPGPAPA